MASNLHEFSPGSRHHDAAHTSVSKRSRTSSPSCRLPAREVEAVAGPAIPCDDRHAAYACWSGGERFFQPGEEGETHVPLIYQFCRQ